jgi:hypothetical protein
MRSHGWLVNIQHFLCAVLAVSGVICISLSIESTSCNDNSTDKAIIIPIGLKAANSTLILSDENCKDWSLDRIIGFLPACISAIGAAMYKVAFKKLMGSLSAGQVIHL